MSSKPVKVVVINTQYVETDAVSFKSVVQRLTGKDATVTAQQEDDEHQIIQTKKPMLSRGISFKDFERMIKDLPPLDELYRLYDDQ